MAYLILIAGLISISAFSKVFVEKERYKFASIASFLFLAIFIVLQDKIGPDHDNYFRIYQSISVTSWMDISSLDLSVEFGYIFVVRFLSVFISSGDMIFRVMVFAMIILVGIGCYKYFDNVPIFLIVFFALSYRYVGILRQITAMSICWLGYGFVIKKRSIKFLLTVLLACFFHTSALVFLTVYPVYHYAHRLKSFNILVVILCVLIVLFNSYVVVIIKSIVGPIFGSRYLAYFNTDNFSVNMAIMLGAIVFACVLMLDLSKIQNKRIINLLMLMMLFESTSAITSVAGRLMIYFYPIIALGLERMLDKDGKRNYELSTTGIIRTTYNMRLLVLVLLTTGLMLFWGYSYLLRTPYVFI